MGTGKYGDKLGKSTVTNHEEPWQTDRGRRENYDTTPKWEATTQKKTPPMETVVGD